MAGPHSPLSHSALLGTHSIIEQLERSNCKLPEPLESSRQPPLLHKPSQRHTAFFIFTSGLARDCGVCAPRVLFFWCCASRAVSGRVACCLSISVPRSRCGKRGLSQRRAGGRAGDGAASEGAAAAAAWFALAKRVARKGVYVKGCMRSCQHALNNPTTRPPLQ